MWYDNEITQNLLKKKYLHEGEKDIHDLINRVSSIYSDEIKEDVKQALYNGDFCPAGRTLYAAGMKGKRRVTLSNCFIEGLVKEDTIESICETDYNISRIGSMGGGVGFAVDRIRPRGSRINNAAQVSDGVAFVIRKINNTGQLVGQLGRGLALMCSINCDHPDIYEFLHIKENNEKLESMNISIRFTDAFMQAVRDDKRVTLYFKVESSREEIKKVIWARDFFHEFCKVNWNYGDPGCIFENKVRNYNLVSGYENYEIHSSNPCAEYMANDGNSCLLQSINLYNMVDNKFTDKATFNFDKFERLVRLSVKMMNETQDYGYDMLPLNKHRKNVDDWRSIGLGILGLADTFIAMGIKYGSAESIAFIKSVFSKMQYWALDESCEEAKKHGTFGKYDWESQKKSPIIYDLQFTTKGHELYDKIETYGLRNSNLLSCAPTGCQKKETIVATEDGLLRLDELINIDGDKWQENGSTFAIQEQGKNRILKGFINGYALTKKIKLYSGISLESTFNHQYRVIRNGEYLWCRADELVEGDIIPSRINYYDKKEYCELVHPKFINYNNISKNVRFPKILDEKFAFVLGCYFANGSTKKNGGTPKYKVIRFAMNAKKEGDINKLMDYCYDVFGVRPRISMSNNRTTCVDMYIASINLCNLFESNGLIKDKSYELHIPKLIRQSPRSVIQSFIDGYSMCDGSFSGNAKYIDTVSCTMAQELAVVFRAIGTDIKISVDEKRTGSLGDRPLYRVYFGGRMSIDNKYMASKQRREILSQVKSILGEDFIFDEVVSIEDSTNMTYDIEVENDHYYLANGVISHNTISLLLGSLSGGIEPLYKCYFLRSSHQNEKDGVSFKVYSRSIEDLLIYHNLPLTLTSEEIKKRFPFVVESHDIAPIDRVKVQANVQKYVDNSVSSTVNLPNSATVEDIYNVFMKAWEHGCKGVTIFRDGCKRGNILGVNKNKSQEQIKYDSIEPIKRRGIKEVSGKTFRMQTACSRLYVTVNYTDNGELFEVFTNNIGGCTSNINSICRLVSAALRSGIKVSTIIEELCAVFCPACQALRKKGEANIELSCGNAIAKALEMSYNKPVRQIKSNPVTNEEEKSGGLYECPECGQKTLKLEAKCVICNNCGYSKCD